MASSSGYVFSTQFMQRFELSLNLGKLGLSLDVDFLDFALEDPVDLSFEPTHVIAVVLLDDELKLCFLPLEFSLADVILGHVIFCVFSCR